ncbi:MAG: hypothetical protein LBP36_03460 [Oscillospiraceae bacterium]|jgi:GTPase SAR1 family protein|nr:hypothetical protein [Oscillospiraceae bacterium]
MKFKNVIFGALAFIFMVPTPAAKSLLPLLRISVAFVGNAGVGKTTFVERLMGLPEVRMSLAPEDYLLPPVSSYLLKDDNLGLELLFRDTPGEEKYRKRLPVYTDCSEIFVIFFSVDDIGSFEAIEDWIKLSRVRNREIKRVFNHGLIGLILVANKIDLDWVISREDIVRKADELKIPVYFCSAKTGIGVDVLRQYMFRLAKKPKLFD